MHAEGSLVQSRVFFILLVALSTEMWCQTVFPQQLRVESKRRPGLEQNFDLSQTDGQPRTLLHELSNGVLYLNQLQGDSITSMQVRADEFVDAFFVRDQWFVLCKQGETLAAFFYNDSSAKVHGVLTNRQVRVLNRTGESLYLSSSDSVIRLDMDPQ